MKALEPYLRARLQRTLVEEIDPQLTSEGLSESCKYL